MLCFGEVEIDFALLCCLDSITCLIKKMSSKKGMVYCLEYMNVCLVSELAEYSNCSVEFHLDMGDLKRPN